VRRPTPLLIRVLLGIAIALGVVVLAPLALFVVSLIPYRLSKLEMVRESPDGSLMAVGVSIETIEGLDIVGNDDEIRLWDMRAGRLPRTLALPKGFLMAMAFTPDGGDCSVIGAYARGAPNAGISETWLSGMSRRANYSGGGASTTMPDMRDCLPFPRTAPRSPITTCGRGLSGPERFSPQGRSRTSRSRALATLGGSHTHLTAERLPSVSGAQRLGSEIGLSGTMS